MTSSKGLKPDTVDLLTVVTDRAGWGVIMMLLTASHNGASSEGSTGGGSLMCDGATGWIIPGRGVKIKEQERNQYQDKSWQAGYTSHISSHGAREGLVQGDQTIQDTAAQTALQNNFRHRKWGPRIWPEARKTLDTGCQWANSQT
ncbi:hypothetical protein Bbelb_357490 [Branchiostoma belcheri]|nr:hypothetical protein Bbelb_357490 [Branchiostoma belcheri]